MPALQPNSIEEFCDVLALSQKQGTAVQVAGGQSKIQPAADAQVISTTTYAGVVDHQASDFTITARAGTPLREVVDTLATVNQHLPFDPTFVSRGATVGGLVASGLNGPCRLKHGGLRDFVIGCQYVDGHGRAVRAGGKVVKNAAGFDLPKFVVGSGGQFGLITEVTFKVFPRPSFYRTFRIRLDRTEEQAMVQVVSFVRKLQEKVDAEAIEILSDGHVMVRAGGESRGILDAVERRVQACKGLIEVVDDDESMWSGMSNCDSVSRPNMLVKIPTSLDRIAELDPLFRKHGYSHRYTAVGNACLLELASLDDLMALHASLLSLGLSGQVVFGAGRGELLGAVRGLAFLRRIKHAMDPGNVFGELVVMGAGATI